MSNYNEIPEKPVLFIDMDGVIADFDRSHYFVGGRKRARSPHEMYEEGFFQSLPVVEGARSAIRALLDSDKYNIYILSKPVRFSSISYSEKAEWIWKYFPELGEKVTLTQNKTLLSGPNRILIDDSLEEWGKPWENQGGTFLFFDYEKDHKTNWRYIMETLI